MSGRAPCRLSGTHEGQPHSAVWGLEACLVELHSQCSTTWSWSPLPTSPLTGETPLRTEVLPNATLQTALLAPPFSRGKHDIGLEGPSGWLFALEADKGASLGDSSTLTRGLGMVRRGLESAFFILHKGLFTKPLSPGCDIPLAPESQA